MTTNEVEMAKILSETYIQNQEKTLEKYNKMCRFSLLFCGSIILILLAFLVVVYLLP